MEDLNRIDSACYALGFDPLADPNRAEQQDQHAAGEVRQAALQGQTNGQAGSTDHGDERSGFHPDHRSHTDQQQYLEDDTGQAADETVQGRIDLAPLQQAADLGGQRIDQPPTE